MARQPNPRQENKKTAQDNATQFKKALDKKSKTREARRERQDENGKTRKARRERQDEKDRTRQNTEGRTRQYRMTRYGKTRQDKIRQGAVTPAGAAVRSTAEKQNHVPRGTTSHTIRYGRVRQSNDEVLQRSRHQHAADSRARLPAVTSACLTACLPACLSVRLLFPSRRVKPISSSSHRFVKVPHALPMAHNDDSFWLHHAPAAVPTEQPEAILLYKEATEKEERVAARQNRSPVENVHSKWVQANSGVTA